MDKVWKSIWTLKCGCSEPRLPGRTFPISSPAVPSSSSSSSSSAHLDLLPVGPRIGEAQPQDRPDADVWVGVADIVADQGEGRVVLVLDAGVEDPDRKKGA